MKTNEYQIVHAGTRRPVRRSNWSLGTVIDGLYRLIAQWPDADFLIVDSHNTPIPASRLKS